MSAKTEFVSSEKREQFRRFDTVIMCAEHAIAALEQAQTLDTPTLTKFRRQIGRLFLPNLRNGVISIPTEYRYTETTPLIVARRGEKYAMDRSFADYTPNQLRSLEQLYPYFSRQKVSEFEHTTVLRQTRRAMRRKSSPTSRLKSRHGAITEPMMLKDIARPDGSIVTLMGRPLITLNHDLVPGVITPVLAHELTHVEQFCAYPFYDEEAFGDELIHDELEALDPDARVGRALFKTGLAAYTNAHVRERLDAIQELADLCDLNPVYDRYAASKVVKHAMKKRGLDYIL